ncbi:MAG: fatty acid desaturase [Myxococcaceae bacterium]|nr:fatty acid desaturase [Myxococcaceae bacterium]MCA3015757.1 fatty acid desaturase [Myxococcaceae bacterium]
MSASSDSLSPAQATTSSVFRYAADRPYVFAFVGLFALDVTAYLTLDHPLLLLLVFGVGIFPKAAVCAFNHHHQHVSTFTFEPLNRLLELMYVLQTGVSSHAWVLHHSVGHHLNYLDQQKDESRWRRADGAVMGEFEYALMTTVTAYPRAWAVGAKHPKLRATLLWMGLASLALMAALVAYRPLPGLILFVLGPLFSLFGTAWATYAHHAGRSCEAHAVASNNMIQPFYNWLTGNLGYHTAHHTRPGVHWSELPKLHDELKAGIPADAYVKPGWPWRWFGAAQTH